MDWRIFMHWKYMSVVVLIVSALALRQGAESEYQLLILILFSPILFCAVAVLGYTESWNVLVLGNKRTIDLFKTYAKPELAKRYNNRIVRIYSANEGIIPDQPFDAVLLALDLNCLRATDSLHELLEAEKQAVKHFGETIYRDIIVVLGYDRTFAKPDNIPDAIDKRAPQRLKELLGKCERRWVEMCLDNQENDHMKRLTRRIDEPIYENCAWNILVLGNKSTINLFKTYAKPGLAKRYNDRIVRIYSANEGIIPDQPFDAVLLALDLNCLRATDSLHELLEAEKQAVKHFGETIYRHIIIVLGYDRTFAKPDNIPDAIDNRAPQKLKELLGKCERRWVEMCLDNHENDHMKGLIRRIDETIYENCGPIKHRIILLGGITSDKNSTAHHILNEDVFGKTEPAECVAVERVVSGKRVLVVNTPSVQPESVDNRDCKTQKKISESLLLTSPGPRVFVMVIKNTKHNDDISACFEVFETRFGKEAYRHLIVVCKQVGQQQNIPEQLRSRRGRLGGRLIFDNGQFYPTEGNYIQEQIMSLIKTTDVESKKKELSLVLIGPNKSGKSHTANNLLDLPESDRIFHIENPQQMKSSVSLAMRTIGEYDVVIADTPSLSRHVMSNEEVLQEIKKCASYPNKRPRPIVVVLRCDRPLNEHEQEGLRFIQRNLPDNFSRTSMVLFTRKNYMELQLEDKMTFREYLKQKGATQGPLQALLSACDWRCVAYENTNADRSRQNQVVFTLVNQVMNLDQTFRLILVGHTGSGKSASGNTIMSTGVSAFNASFSQTSNTEKCQVEEFEVDGKRVRLVDTPGLFDTRPQYTIETTMQELCKSVLYTLPGPHAFLFVINATGRFTMETEESMRILKQTFGHEMLRYMVVIFTRLDELQRENRTVESIIDEIRQGGSVVSKEFFDNSGEYVAFDNRPGKQTGREAHELLEAVQRVVAANEHHHFTNETYKDCVVHLPWYGTGSKFNLRYPFEKHPAQCATACSLVAPLNRNLTRKAGYVSAWYDTGVELCQDVEEGEVLLEVGDRLEVAGVRKFGNPEGDYQHWAVVYQVSPEPLMIHFTVPGGDSAGGAFRGSAISSASGSHSGLKGAKGNAGVIVDKIGSYDRKLRVNNKKDSSSTVLPVNEIKENMRKVLDDRSLVGQYKLLENNCEHFANYTRYGRKESDQVTNNPLARFAGNFTS